jgi:hypothetical protein
MLDFTLDADGEEQLAWMRTFVRLAAIPADAQ